MLTRLTRLQSVLFCTAQTCITFANGDIETNTVLKATAPLAISEIYREYEPKSDFSRCEGDLERLFGDRQDLFARLTAMFHPVERPDLLRCIVVEHVARSGVSAPPVRWARGILIYHPNLAISDDMIRPIRNCAIVSSDDWRLIEPSILTLFGKGTKPERRLILDHDGTSLVSYYASQGWSYTLRPSYEVKRNSERWSETAASILMDPASVTPSERDVFAYAAVIYHICRLVSARPDATLSRDWLYMASMFEFDVTPNTGCLRLPDRFWPLYDKGTKGE